MCIIVYKPAGVALPSKNILRNCWDNNDDGAGFMYPLNDGVRISKGYMNFDDFMRDIHALKNLKEKPLVIHFRIATHGKVSASMTHPFPVCSDEKLLLSTRTTCRFGLAHNGVIPIAGRYGGVFGNQLSDTAIFVRDYASLIISDGWDRNKNNIKLIERIAESKLAIMGPDGKVTLIGRFIENDGCYYSNMTFENYSTSLRSYSFSTLCHKKKYTMKKHLAFVESHMVIAKNNFSDIIDPNDGLYAVDIAGNVYEYDETENVARILGGYTAYDFSRDSNDYDDCIFRADKNNSMLFTVEI